MNKRRLFVIASSSLVLWIFFYTVVLDKGQLTNVHTDSTKADPNIQNIWHHRCLNGGIYYPNHCRCPPNISGKFCGTDNCTPNVQWLPSTANANGSASVCQFSPAVFHCYREDIKRRDLIRVNRLNDYDSVSSQLEFIFDYYGPWTTEDTMILHYLLKPNDFANSKHDVSVHNKRSLAFVIMLHSYPDVFSLHWKYLYRPYHQYVIHLDTSMDQKSIDLVFLTIGNASNVEILDLRFDGVWGGVSLVYIEIAALARLVAKNAQFSHVINLSNNDFLIKPVERLEDFLMGHNKVSIVQGALRGNPVRDRYKKLHYYCPIPERNKILTWSKNQEPDDTNYAFKRPNMEYKAGGWGSQWHMLSRDLVEFIVTDMRALEVLMSLKHSLIPDEYYFQLVSKSFDFLVNDNDTHRWINWASVPREQMVTEADVPVLRAEREKFFTRKVQIDVARVLIKELL